jgi:predicted ATP-dependent endonuclease of OLD family
MQIKWLHIDNYLCLNNFDIRFNTIKDVRLENGGSSTILIGENGSGKSTTLKAILDIITSFDPSASTISDTPFDYTFEYNYAQQDISIKKEGKNYTIQRNRKKLCEGDLKTITSFLDKEIRIFPERVVAFYSGSNRYFYEKILKFNKLYASESAKIFNNYMVPNLYKRNISFPKQQKKKYIYCDESYVPIYLAAILAGQDSYEKKLIRRECNLFGTESIEIKLKIVDSLNLREYRNTEKLLEDRLYPFINYFDNKLVRIFRNGFWGYKSGIAVYRLRDIDKLNIDFTSLLDLFEKLKLFFKAEFQVYAGFYNKSVSDKNLSEGQRQLIKILGMLSTCKSVDSLILMDEPDAHMNPRWKYNIKTIIDDVLKQSKNAQALIATHDPLVINGVSKDFIRIFERDDEGYTKVVKPETNTEGMGIDGLLQSEYYGLKTSYDKQTTDNFIRRQKLFEKLIDNKINDSERNELRRLTEQIGSMPISTNTIDFLYDDFIREFRKTKYYTEEYLSSSEMKRRNEKIKEIIRTLYEKK